MSSNFEKFFGSGGKSSDESSSTGIKKKHPVKTIKGKSNMVKHIPVMDEYKPSVYIDSKQQAGIEKLAPGQKVLLGGTVVSKTTRQKKGDKTSHEVSIEVGKIQN